MCPEDRCPQSAMGFAQEVSDQALAADLLLIGGATVAAVGLLLTLLLREEPSESTVACGPGGCQLRGQF